MMQRKILRKNDVGLADRYSRQHSYCLALSLNVSEILCVYGLVCSGMCAGTFVCMFTYMWKSEGTLNVALQALFTFYSFHFIKLACLSVLEPIK